MTVIAINEGQILSDDRIASLAEYAASGPVVVMIHGYRYAPDHPRHDPHRHILSASGSDAVRERSWPLELGFNGTAGCGLALPFGWNARGSLSTAYRHAHAAGADLARLVGPLARQTGRPVAIIAHSLGARVALSALAQLAVGTVGRLVLMAAAEFQCAASDAMSTPAGQGAEVLNVTSRENDLFDFGLELAVGGLRRRTLGHGLLAEHPRWLDMQIDHPGTIEGLRGLGFSIGAQVRRCCHWSAYRREGLLPFYRTALRDPDRLPLDLLRRHLPDDATPRWSRLLAAPGWAQAATVTDHMTADHA